MEWQAVFFDFDGVILDSVDIKTEAFAEMFRPYGPDIEKKVVDYHLAHGGISRYEKFKYYYNNFLHKNITDPELNQLGEIFTDIVFEKVVNAPFINGALDTIKALYNKNIPMFIVSGTPQDELEKILTEKRIKHFFKGVYGSPKNKDGLLEEVKRVYKYNLSTCLLIGDSMSDYHSAISTKTNFLGIVAKDKLSPFPYYVKTLPNLQFLSC